MREPHKAISKQTEIEIADMVISLIVLSQVDRFTTDRQAISSALMHFLGKTSSALPKLDFRTVGEAVYCDSLNKTLNLLMLCGMLGLENPEFRYFRVSPLMKKKYEASVKWKLSAHQMEELSQVAKNVFGAFR